MTDESREELLARIQQLQDRLEESEETLRAVVASAPASERVSTDEGYRLLVEVMAEGALTLTADGLILFSNEPFATMVKVPLERVIGCRVGAFLAPEDAGVFAALLEEAAVAHAQAEIRFRAPDGTLVPAYVSGSRLQVDGIECVCLVVTDLTERKRNQEIVAAEKLARSILDQAAEATFVLDPDGRIIRASRAAERLAGGPVLLRSFDELFHIRLSSAFTTYPFREMLSAATRDQRIEGIEVTAVMSDRRIELLLSAAPLAGADSQLLGCILTLTDITQRKRFEAALRESESQERSRAAELQAIFDAVPAALFIARNPDCRHILGSRMTYELFKLPSGSNVSMSAAENQKPASVRPMRDGIAIPPDDLPLRVAARTGQVVRNYEFDLVSEDGVRRLLGDAVPLLDESGRPRGGVAAFVDITERKWMEERIREAQKLESIGLLAGGIAHDFNNILTGILGNTSLALDDLPPSHPVVPYLRNADAASRRAADLTRQLLAYAGKGRFLIDQVDVSRLIRDISELIRTSVPKHIDLLLELDRDLPPIEADTGQMQQLLMNLVINAAEAIDKPQGRVQVCTSLEQVDREYIRGISQPSEISPGTYVRIEVSDDGCGMDQSTLERIFEPFFTTKFTGRGLGLAAAQGIVRGHKGALKVHSEPGRGTTFVVLLPAAVDSVQAPESGLDLTPASRATGTVLVVDDEETVRSVAKSALERCGYSVLLAGNGAEALDLFASHADRISLVLLDLAMPVLGGEEAYRRLKAVRTNVKILLMSGYGEVEAMRRFKAHDVSGFIQKPFTAASLVQKLTTTLSGKAG